MSELGDIALASAEFYNSLVGLIDRRIGVARVREETGVEVIEERAVMFEEMVGSVVFAGDPEGTIEVVVTGKPRNRNMLLGEVSGVLVDIWVPLGIPELVGQRVAVVPSVNPDRPGYELVGTYGRRGGRVS